MEEYDKDENNLADYPYLKCKKCGNKHRIYLQNKDKTESIPMHICKDCMYEFHPITEQIRFDELPDVCNPNILQTELSETMKKTFVDG